MLSPQDHSKFSDIPKMYELKATACSAWRLVLRVCGRLLKFSAFPGRFLDMLILGFKLHCLIGCPNKVIT